MSSGGVLNGRDNLRATLVGEVIESTSTDFTAQACELDSAPPFGAFVQVSTSEDDLTLYGIVAQVQTAGIDPGARPVMRGHGNVRDDLIYRENPDLPLVLRTTFRALVVGFESGGVCRQFLPPRPPRLHYSVFISTPADVRRFIEAGFDYLSAVLTAVNAPVDELLAANFRLTAAQQRDPERFTSLAGRELAQLLRTDYVRLTAILRRCLVDPCMLEVAS